MLGAVHRSAMGDMFIRKISALRPPRALSDMLTLHLLVLSRPCDLGFVVVLNFFTLVPRPPEELFAIPISRHSFPFPRKSLWEQWESRSKFYLSGPRESDPNFSEWSLKSKSRRRHKEEEEEKKHYTQLDFIWQKTAP